MKTAATPQPPAPARAPSADAGGPAAGTQVAELDGCALVDLSVELPEGELANWCELRAVRCGLSLADLGGGSFTDVVLERCDLANVHALQASWRRVELDDCRATGAMLGEADLRDVTFRRCRMDLANLRGARLRQVAFVECELTGADLQRATLTDVTFEDCTFGDADFGRAACQRVTFRGANLASVKGAAGLKGALVPWPEIVEMAGAMAGALGIGVLDVD
jgi:uncharacterized protein YjbI with pentapeptide repeats